MDKTTRWLPILAVVLIAEAIATFLIPGNDPISNRSLAVIAAMLGLVTLVRALKGGTNPESWGAPGLAVFCLLSVMVVGSYLYLRPFRSSRVPVPLLYFNVPAYVLMGAGGALLWAAALARREQPDHPRLSQLGRIGAGIAQLGFFFAFIYEIPSFGAGLNPGVPSYALNSVIRLVVRVLLLWSSVQMMRTGGDSEVLHERLTRVHYLMLAWAAMMIVNSLVTIGNTTAMQPTPLSHVPNFLRNVLYVTVIVINAFILAGRFRHLPKEQPVAA